MSRSIRHCDDYRRAIAAIAVAALAFALRWPSCGESLWVDELHSAWTVSGTFGDVAPRAAAGNQTPWFFYPLWFFGQLTGTDSPAIRFPSVVAVSLASGLLVVAIGRRRGLAIGIFAGLFLAVERSSLYFGTEARAYSGVILAITILIAIINRRDSAKHDFDRWITVALTGAVACTAVLMHITAGVAVMAVLGVLVLRAVSSWVLGSKLPSSSNAILTERAHSAAILLGLGLSILISWPNVSRSWQVRQQWTAFGASEKLSDVWTMWPWAWCFFVPVLLILFISIFMVFRTSNQNDREQSPLADSRLASGLNLCACIWLVIVLATLGVWLLSYLEIAPLWHRRFLVGLLPLICWGAAESWALLLSKFPRQQGWHKIAIGIVAAVGLMWWQGTLPTTNPQLVRRQEHWRSAVQFVNEQIAADPGSLDVRVLVAAELIESNSIYGSRSDWQAGKILGPVPIPLREYLLYPVSGPYSFEASDRNVTIKPTGSLAHPQTARVVESSLASAASEVWLVVRRPKSTISTWLSDLANTTQCQASSFQFGKVTVVRLVPAVAGGPQ